MKRRAVLRTGLAVAGGAAAVGVTAAVLRVANASSVTGAGPTIAVDADTAIGKLSSGLTGVNANEWYDDGDGLWDSRHDQPNPEVIDRLRDSAIGLVRYPGGTCANLFRWKKAIGPQDERGRQVSGSSTREPRDSRFGPDEYMRVIEELGIEPQIMANFATSTAAEIADWVAYMNAPEGTEWGDKRAANGHPEPYGVRRWEIGNEIHLEGTQRYWLSDDLETGLRQYVFGGTQRQRRQLVGAEDDHRDAAAVSDGSGGQRFTVWFPPVVPDSQTIRVGGRAWREVGDLSSAGANDRVYTFEPESGAIGFGDGEHGAVPKQGAKITADYDSGPHEGFVDYYAAMKKVDPDIEVVAIWSPLSRGKLTGGKSFPEFMADNDVPHEYDAVAVHPYTNFVRDLDIEKYPGRKAGHDLHLVGEAAATKAVAALRREVDKYGRKDASVAVTECGALWFNGHKDTAYPDHPYAMSHVVYMASQWAHYANMGLACVIGNDLITAKPGPTRTVLGGAPDYLFSADAVARRQLRDLVHGGGEAVHNTVHDNIEVSTEDTPIGSSYEALVTTAAADRDGNLRVLVVNRTADDDIDATVSLSGFAHTGTVAVSVVAGDHFYSFNDADRPDDVRIEESREQVDGDEFTMSFGAHSLTLLSWKPNRDRVSGTTRTD